jgi:serine/threonine protein kinase/WD40 repeat protein
VVVSADSQPELISRYSAALLDGVSDFAGKRRMYGWRCGESFVNDLEKQQESLFNAARQLTDLRQRAAFLEAACGGDADLRRRLDELFAAQPEAEAFFEKPASGARAALPATSSDIPQGAANEVTGTIIGRYKLLEKIGDGGFGSVYMAEQKEPVKRRVALKIIKFGMDTHQVVARFEAERQALALMDHPNIAKVFDAGATESGRPYFVMELVSGVPITQYCDQNHLPPAERLELFMQVCRAIQHAHQKGIIHRDIKPSNILVTRHDGVAVPKVIDFGIAKATQQELTEKTLFTQFHQFIGTPAYMSPEQAERSGVDIDTRSDIYSLGVLLYELLTGMTPFDGKELLAAGLDEMRRTIREEEPVRPSTRLSTMAAAERTTVAAHRQFDVPKLIHLLRGDLDWIVMKALEKDRTRRYETANALAMDLQRHLKNEPVAARPPSRFYVFQKTVRRHKVGFAAATVVMIVLAAGVLISSLEAARARRAEVQARHTGYVADMDLANRALDEGDLGIAQTLLRRYWPGPHEADLRNWEWRYLANLSEGDPHFSLVAHSTDVLSLRFLDDNTLLTAGETDWRTVLWNLKERRPSNIITNRGFGGGVSEVSAVAPKRNAMYYRAAVHFASGIGEIDLQKGELRNADNAFPDVEAPIKSLEISPDEKVLAVAYGNKVGLWDLDGKTWLKPFEAESGLATQGLFSPDGRVLVIADEEGLVAFWNLAERRKRGVLTNAPGSLGVLRFSADGRWLVNPGGKSPTQIWSAEDRTLVAELRDSVVVDRAVFSADGRWLATVGGEPSVRLWETSSWQKTRTLHGHTDPITAVDFSPNGKLLATGARNGEVKLWPLDEPPTAPERASFPASAYLQLAADGSAFCRILQSALSNGVASLTAEVWTTTPLQRTFTVALTASRPSSGCVLTGGRGLVLGGFDGSIRVVGPVVGQEIVVTNAHKAEVYIMDASLDGSTLATKAMPNWHADEPVRIWRLPRLEPIAELPRAQHVHGIKLSDDGKLLAGFTGPGDMGVWEIPSMKGPPMWRGVAAGQIARVCAFSPDNRWLAAATPEGGAFLWNLATHRRTVLPRALTQYTSLSFSPDGSRLAAGSEGESKLFDTATGQAVLSFKQAGLKLAFARDGESLLAVHSEGASVFHAPALDKLRFDWLKEKPSQEVPAYLGPDTNYTRPDRP